MQKRLFSKRLIQLVILILLLELSLRIIFYQETGREGLAVVELAKNIKRKIMAPGLEVTYRNFLLARPDSSKEANRQIAEESFASNHFEYSPWTEYKNIDFSGKYINTKGLTRLTVPDTFINPDTTAVKTIYFFGGSTMYGVNITDRETIASAFVDLYKKQFPHGVSIRVVNYGIPAYHSYNELMLLTHLVYSNQQPDIAIVFDGLNDFLMPTAVEKRLPYYYFRLKQASKDKINFKELERINDSTNTLFNYPAGYSEEMLTDTLLKNYVSNTSQIRKLAAASHFGIFFFIQPNPFFNYPNRKNDPVCDSMQAPLVTRAYQVLEKTSRGENSFFLGNMLAERKGYPFIDRFHYSPAMCREIAREIVIATGAGINHR